MVPRNSRHTDHSIPLLRRTEIGDCRHLGGFATWFNATTRMRFRQHRAGAGGGLEYGILRGCAGVGVAFVLFGFRGTKRRRVTLRQGLTKMGSDESPDDAR